MDLVKEKEKEAMVIKSLPYVSSAATTYMLIPEEGVFKDVQLGAAYLPGTLALQKLGVLVKDRRKEFVSAIGSFIAAGAALAILGSAAGGPAPTRPHLPITINVSDEVLKKGSSEISCDGSGCGTLKLDAEPDKGLTVETYFASAGTFVNTFPVPVCRGATVQIEGKDFPQATFRAYVHDRRYVQPVRLPYKGAITMNPPCGADVVAEEIASDSVWTLISEAASRRGGQIENRANPHGS